jgi:2-keto-4-pentenoate hydratase/2-oxohepta-3-ene-1,7-dioic acid hydratase in catechol pathway
MRFVVSNSALGVVVDDRVYWCDSNLGDDPLGQVLASGGSLSGLAEAAISRGQPQELPVKLDPPIRHPSKVLAIGLNYQDHCRETNTPIPESPIEFSKHPSSLTGHMHPITLDERLSAEVDYEVELAVIIGERCKDLTADSALSVVAGYTVGNDVSARDLQLSDGQWVRAKSFDGFAPLGPVFVTADEIRDPQSLTLQTRLDGELLQDSSTSEMVFPVDQLLEFVSRRTTLLPGDIVFTGTPHGCGAFRDPKIFLRPGSTVECSIEGIGTLTNPVVSYE